MELDRKLISGNQRDKHGNLIFEKSDRLARWKEYVEELLDDARPNYTTIPGDVEPDEDEINQEITEEEVLHTIRNIKNGKAVGPDEMHCELLKLLSNNQLSIAFPASFLQFDITVG